MLITNQQYFYFAISWMFFHISHDTKKYLFFSCIFQTIRSYLPLVAGKTQRKKSHKPQNPPNLRGFWVYGLKNTLLNGLDITRGLKLQCLATLSDGSAGG